MSLATAARAAGLRPGADATTSRGPRVRRALGRPRAACAGHRRARPPAAPGACRRSQPLRVVRRRRRRPRARLRDPEHAAHDGAGSRGVAVGQARAAVRRPAGHQRPRRRRELRDQARQGSAGSVPGVLGPRAAGLNVCELVRARPGGAGVLREPGRGAACASSTCSTACARRHPAWPSRRSLGARERSASATRARASCATRGWRLPGRPTTRDGVLANLYGVAVCPQITFACAAAGAWRGTSFGELRCRRA